MKRSVGHRPMKGKLLKTAMRLAVAAPVLFLLLSCAGKNQFVLLPEADGKTGKILVSTKGGQQVLTEAKQATDIEDADKAPSKPFPMSDEEIESAYGEALSALPQPPVHFILYFKSGSVELSDESREVIGEVLKEAKRRKSADISIVGHTDRVGSREANFKLGMERTEMVKRMFVVQGIDGEYIDTSSHGEDNPLIKTDDETTEPRNRRVEVVVR